MTAFNPDKAIFKSADFFQRFRLPKRGTPISKAKIADDTHILVAERNGVECAVTLQQMAYHHIAQGTLGGEPFVISF